MQIFELFTRIYILIKYVFLKVLYNLFTNNIACSSKIKFLRVIENNRTSLFQFVEYQHVNNLRLRNVILYLLFSKYYCILKNKNKFIII